MKLPKQKQAKPAEQDMPDMPDPTIGDGPDPSMGGAPDPKMGGEPQGPDPSMGGAPDPTIGDESDDEMPEGPDQTMGDEEDSEDGDDSKKKIQKLAGELSELLHTYNEENGEDEELNKYVKGMIDAQTDGEDEDSDSDDDENDSEEDDDKDIDIDIQNDSDDDEEDNDEEGDEPDEPEAKDFPEKMKEGVAYTKRQIREGFGSMNDELVNKKNNGYSKNTRRTNKKRNNPFNPPKFN